MAHGAERIRLEHLKNLSPLLINNTHRSWQVTWQNARFLINIKLTTECSCTGKDLQDNGYCCLIGIE